MPFKLVAIDLDDTFINDRHQFTKRTKEAVNRTLEKGIPVVIATGRSYAGVKRYIDRLHLKTPSIVCGGAIVVDSKGNQVYESYVPHALAKKVLEYGQSLKVHTQIYKGKDFIFPKRTDYVKIYEDVYGFPGVEIPDLLSSKDLSTPKVLFISEAEKIAEIKKEAETLFPELVISRSKPYYLEFNNPQASKGAALEFLANRMGIAREDIIAIGDSEIDASMIEYAGLGVAMENAIPSVREKAQFITYSNNREGVAFVLEKYILEG